MGPMDPIQWSLFTSPKTARLELEESRRYKSVNLPDAFSDGRWLRLIGDCETYTLHVLQVLSSLFPHPSTHTLLSFVESPTLLLMSASEDQEYESVLLVVRECYGK